MNYLTSELAGKRLGLLHELLPMLSVVAVLWNPGNPTSVAFIRDLESAAPTIRMRTHVMNATSEIEIDSAFASLRNLQAGALLVANDPFFTTRRQKIVSLAVRHAMLARTG